MVNGYNDIKLKRKYIIRKEKSINLPFAMRQEFWFTPKFLS